MARDQDRAGGVGGTVAEVLTAAAELAQLYDRLVRRLGNLSLTQYRILAFLRARSPRPCEPRDLRALKLSSAHVTTLLDQLERAGLVERAPHPADARRRLVALTGDGAAWVDAVSPHVAALEERLVGATLDAGERAALRGLLARLRATVARLDVPDERIARGGP